jgi:hypothetical protein
MAPKHIAGTECGYARTQLFNHEKHQKHERGVWCGEGS